MADGPRLGVAAVLGGVLLALSPARATDGDAASASPNPLIIDVRDATEFAAGHIPGAINLPLSRFDCTGLPASRGREIVLQCRTGRRSAEALAICHRQGRTDISRHLEGGIEAWVAAGGAVTRPDRATE